MDVKIAVLNGDLEEDVYVQCPPTLKSQDKNKKVCRIKKALYRAQQSLEARY